MAFSHSFHNNAYGSHQSMPFDNSVRSEPSWKLETYPVELAAHDPELFELSLSPRQDSLRQSDFIQSLASTLVKPRATDESRPQRISTAFPQQEDTDVVLLSFDSVAFHVHSQTVLGASDNAFGFRLLQPGRQEDDNDVIQIDEHSEVLNILLHIIYSISCISYQPSFEVLQTAAERMRHYGMVVNTYVQPSTPMFDVLSSHAPGRALHLYALAAHFDLYDLAVVASEHLLSFRLSSLTEDMVKRIGAPYLRCLFALHLGRKEALKRVLITPPRGHPTTLMCTARSQEQFALDWVLIAAQIVSDASPDISSHYMVALLRPLKDQTSCETCKANLYKRLEQLTEQWGLVKRTI
ncbi:uncharacterized protein BT62DRAFT_923381 [Guyanagaster necrorhizus]|uniref:BTB domain-containing protein n=1 Tax=Guyanagaster necrorhizus TaxID=856835 RepID=A0A9P7VI17_9AGAR|nr:uncharacterized protein BT62DRAFT_923381 [Guyanagaster necrorhizus MCA 3950]KAG7441433.1 hypothetical protein BT62DRAFT_923381 [Guyanagaster necrorhizus MCA 3950]